MYSHIEAFPPHERQHTVFHRGFWFHSNDVKVIYLNLLDSLPVPRALEKFVTGCCFDAAPPHIRHCLSAAILVSLLAAEGLHCITRFTGNLTWN